MSRKFFVTLAVLLTIGGTVIACATPRVALFSRICLRPAVQVAPVVVQPKVQVIPAPAPVVVPKVEVTPAPVVTVPQQVVVPQVQMQTIQVPVQTVQTVQVPVQTVQTFAAVSPVVVPVAPVPFLLRGHLFPRLFPCAATHNAVNFGVY